MATLMAGDTASAQNPGTYPRRPNQTARDLTGRTYVSHSQLACMRACPRQFSYRYLENARPDFVPGGPLFGVCFHAAIQVHFLQLRDGLGSTGPSLLAAFENAWHRQHSGSAPPVKFNTGESFGALRELAGRMLDRFLGSPVSRPPGEIVGVEQELRVILDPDLPDLLARVDLVTRDGSGLQISDFKTARARWTPDRALEAGEQLLLYAHALQAFSSAPWPDIQLQFVVLTKTKNPAVQVLPVPLDAAGLATLRNNVRTIWRAIQAGHFYPSPSPMHCAPCPYRSRCPIFGGHAA